MKQLQHPLLDERVVHQVADVIYGNANREGLRTPLPWQESLTLARDIIVRLISGHEFPRLIDTHGLRFIVHLRGEWNGPDSIFVSTWNEHRWAPIQDIVAPGQDASGLYREH